MTPSPRRVRSATFAALGVLAAANLTRRWVPPVLWHIGTTATLVGIAGWSGLGIADLGLERRRVRDGLRFGGVAFAGISTVVLIGGVAGLVNDDRVEVSAQQLAVRVLVLIPLGTVLVEELAFRGVLHGLVRRWLSPRAALAVASVAFGLWHVYPTATGGGLQSGDTNLVALVAGTFLATTIAGVGFEWLRTRSGSLVAPMLAHLATNSVTFTVAWVVR